MGGHTVLIEADLLRIATHGPLSAVAIEQLFQRIATVLREHGRAYLLVDARRGISLDHATRRQVTQLTVKFVPTAVAVFGATVPQQAMLILMGSVVQVVRGKRVPLRLSRSESEAEAWLLAQRP